MLLWSWVYIDCFCLFVSLMHFLFCFLWFCSSRLDLECNLKCKRSQLICLGLFPESLFYPFDLPAFFSEPILHCLNYSNLVYFGGLITSFRLLLFYKNVFNCIFRFFFFPDDQLSSSKKKTSGICLVLHWPFILGKFTLNLL